MSGENAKICPLDDLTAAWSDLTDAEASKLREVYEERVLG